MPNTFTGTIVPFLGYRKKQVMCELASLSRWPKIQLDLAHYAKTRNVSRSVTS